MIRFARLGVTLVIVISAANAHSADTPAKYKTQNIVLFVMDGARYSETWGEPTHQYIPNLAGPLAKEGATFTQFKNKGTTKTDPGHTALVTGFYEDLENSGKVLPAHASFLQAWLKSTGQPKTSAWIVASKDKLEILGNTRDPEWNGKFTPSTDCGLKGLGTGYRPDEATWEAVKSTLSRDHPRLLVINFQEPDSSGHKKDWVRYIHGIQDKDEYAGQLWKLLQADPFYAGKTAFFLTNDHGRHLDSKGGFQTHGDDCEGCRHIFLYAAGPDFKKNAIIDTEREQIDVPATIAELLGIPLPDCKGHVITELFEK